MRAAARVSPYLVTLQLLQFLGARHLEFHNFDIDTFWKSVFYVKVILAVLADYSE